MSAQRFSAGKQFCWRDTTCEVKQMLPRGEVRVENVLTGEVTIIKLSSLVEALFDGELQFVIKGKHMPPSADGNGSTASKHMDLADFPEHLVAIARYRLEVIKPLLEMKPEERTRAVVDACVCKVQATRENQDRKLLNSMSVTSVYRWIRDYAQSGGDLRSLIPGTGKRGGKGVPRLTSEVEAIIESAIRDRYYVREAITIDDVMHEIALRIEEENQSRAAHEKLSLPSRRTVSRRINAQDIPGRFAAKYGRRTAKRKLSQYENTDYPQVPLERVEIDHTLIDLIVIDDQDNLPLGRLTLTYCLDMATRYPLGYYLGFEPPSYLTVMECLHHAICPKGSTKERYGTENEWVAYGIPSTLVIDNGKEFIGQDLQDACLLLGIVLQQTPVRTPHFKAGIERLFGSLNTMLFHTLPGTTFSDSQERNDYDSIKQACVYLSEVDRIMNIFIVDIYAQRLHRGIEEIPSQRWKKAVGPNFSPRVPPTAEELSILLGRVTYRVIQHYGIQFQSLRYNSPELTLLRTMLRGEKAKIKYHPAELKCLYVYDPFSQRYIEVPALDQEYTRGLSLWKHRIIRKVARDEYDCVDLAALGRAKRKIQEIVETGRNRKRLGTRTRIARWDTGGKPTRQMEQELETHDTPNEQTLPAVDTTVLLAQSAPVELDEHVSMSVAEQASGEWEITYDLPKSCRGTLDTTDGRVKNEAN